MTPKGQPPRNLSGTKTAYAMATLEPHGDRGGRVRRAGGVRDHPKLM
jgi:hypothetical protein